MFKNWNSIFIKYLVFEYFHSTDNCAKCDTSTRSTRLRRPCMSSVTKPSSRDCRASNLLDCSVCFTCWPFRYADIGDRLDRITLSNLRKWNGIKLVFVLRACHNTRYTTDRNHPTRAPPPINFRAGIWACPPPPSCACQVPARVATASLVGWSGRCPGPPVSYWCRRRGWPRCWISRLL